MPKPRISNLRNPAWRRLQLLLALLCAASLSACATNIGETLPHDMGGLPASAPARPAEAYAYPAIHDMPPDRSARPLTEEQQKKIEADLIAARNRQRGGPAQPPKKPAPIPAVLGPS